MNVNNLKKDTVYVLNKNEGILAVFDKEDEDTLIDPRIEEVQNAEAKLIFQVPATSEKWKSTYNPENLYLVNDKVFSANFTDSIERERTDENEDLITVVAYERQMLLQREYVRAWNSETGFDNIDDFMVVILSGGDLPLKNNGTTVTTTYSKGTSGYVLQGLLYGTGWSVGTCDVTGTFDLETDQETIYDNILKVQEIWGGILVFDSLNKVVHHRDETIYLPYSGYEVRYQKNLQSSKYIGDNKIITELCPLGEGGLNIKLINDGSLWLTNYSYTNSSLKAIENNDDIYEQEQLKRWGERKLQELCKPRRELTMTTALLKNVEGYENEEVHLNDIVDVIDFEFVEDRVTQLRVIEHKYYLWSGADADLVIGDITLESTDIFKKTIKATNLINNGTLDTSKIVDYYKNGESLRKILRQIDQVIIDTKSELTQTDDEIKASVEQTITRVDNLNNDIVSQDRKISQLIIEVDRIESKVSTLADLTETITSYDGEIVLEDAIKGYLIGLSIHGYDGSFVATYISEDTIISDDLYILDNEIIIDIYTKNICPTENSEWEVENFLLNNNIQNDTVNTNFYLTVVCPNPSNPLCIVELIHLSSGTFPYRYYIEIQPNHKYKISVNTEDYPTTINYISVSCGTFSEDVFSKMANNPNKNIIANASFTNISHINDSFVYDNTKTTFEIVSGPNDKYLFLYLTINGNLAFQYLNVYDLEQIGSLKSGLIEVDSDYSAYFSIKSYEDVIVSDIRYYDENKNYLTNFYKYYSRKIENGLSNTEIIFPLNTKYIMITLKKKDNQGNFIVFDNYNIEEIKPMLEYAIRYKYDGNYDNTYSGQLPDWLIELNSIYNYGYFYMSNVSSIKATNTTEFEIEYKEFENENEYSAIIGSGSDGIILYTKTDGNVSEHPYNEKMLVYNGNNYIINTQNTYLNTKTKVSLKLNDNTGNYILKFEDENENIEEFDINSTEQFESTETFSLFSNKTTNTRCNIELYSCKIWENNELVLNFIPALRKNNSRIGLYNTVSGLITTWNDYAGLGSGGIKYFIAPNSSFAEYNKQRIKFLIDDELRSLEIVDSETETTELVYDEFQILDNRATLIRRIGIDSQGNKYVLTNPQYINYGEILIPLVTGDNYLKIDRYTPTIIVEYVKQNKYTDIFATTYQVESYITQLANSITLLVKEKIGLNEVIAALNLEVANGIGTVEITGNHVIIDSDFFHLTADGEIIAAKGLIGSWHLEDGLLYGNSTYNNIEYQTGIDTRDDVYAFYAGLNRNYTNPLDISRSNTYITKTGEIHTKQIYMNAESGYIRMIFDSGRTAMNFTPTEIQFRLDDNANNLFARITREQNDFTIAILAVIGFRIYDQLHDRNLYNISPLYFDGSKPQHWFTGRMVCDKNADGSWVEVALKSDLSDSKVKKDIKDSTTNALEIIDKLKFKQFTWDKTVPNAGKHVNIGIIAQDLQKIDENYIESTTRIYEEKEEKLLSINVLNLLTTTTKAVQELSQKVKDLEKEIKKLKGEI